MSLTAGSAVLRDESVTVTHVSRPGWTAGGPDCYCTPPPLPPALTYACSHVHVPLLMHWVVLGDCSLCGCAGRGRGAGSLQGSQGFRVLVGSSMLGFCSMHSTCGHMFAAAMICQRRCQVCCCLVCCGVLCAAWQWHPPCSVCCEEVGAQGAAGTT